ncbi:hypothetical protein CsSME_00005546 [Camellia sinensis var. sinensis]
MKGKEKKEYKFSLGFLLPCLLCFANVAQLTTLQISPRLPVEKSPGSKHGAIVLCERVLIHVVKVNPLHLQSNYNVNFNDFLLHATHVVIAKCAVEMPHGDFVASPSKGAS